ncbi:MerR family DNA-binding transcriptional regulator [Actinomadura sp. KC06]|uniref:MerR family transcriptional regulator n=1 Tax=Actinomadura sp. KC06 TaxID=2530369 RepID=UPI0010499EB3|nr:MerR family transcriptional regulator [Actinomadura sp. KC06]TDD21681.1 MerR family DNA-binding transcriptional regulator [Actinomadura sp. KC06]
MSDDLLPIGRFARLCRLSVKQLRHYDDLGLLVPAWTDPASGYRYYRPGQARDALLIGLLRSMDVPLPTVARVLPGGGGGDGDGAGDALKEARDRIEADVARRQRGLRLLDRVVAEGLPQAEVSIVREPARRVFTAREPATPLTIPDATGACVGRLLHRMSPDGLLIGLFPLDMDEEFDVRVVVQADDGDDVLPGGSFASAVHVGPYEEIPLTVHGVLAWFGDYGHVPAGPVREVYLNDPATTPPEHLETRVQIRVEDAQ